MRVKCIDDWDDWNETRISITKGKVYEICGASSSDGRFAIRGDDGKLITFVCDIYKNKFFEIVKEDKMENKIKIDDKVILRTDIAFQVPFGVTKGTILNVDSIEGDKARVSTLVVSFVAPLELLIKVEEGKEIKEDVRIVRKLEDLDGLENGMGAYLKFNKNAKSVDVHEFRTESFITSRSVYNGDHMFLSVIKSMGFKFEYKPTRTLNEVVEEMKLETDDAFEDSENYELYEVAFEKSAKHYKIRLAETVGAPVFIDDKLAQKYADELNEIIGKVK